MLSSVKNSPAIKSILCLTAGGLTALAFAPYSISFVVFLTLAIQFCVWYQSQSIWHSFLYGYAFGFGFFGVGVNWLHVSINLFGGVNLIGAYLATYALVAFLALYPAFVGTVNQYLFRQTHCSNFLIVLPCLWTLSEWFRSWIFTGFPWLNLGYSQTDTLLSAFAPILGVYGITFLICLTSASLCILLMASGLKKIYAPLLLALIWITGLQLEHMEWSKAKDATLEVALIQGAIPQKIKWNPEQADKTIELYRELSEPHWGKDIILWPETALPFFYHQAKPLIDQFRSHAKESKTQLILGIPYKETDGNRYYNAVVNVGVDNDMYFKKHLVPFGEYLPFNDQLRPMLHWLKIPMSNFSKGQQDKPVLKAGSNYIGASICYEDVFGEEIITALPEASVLLNVSNDAWFGNSSAPHQHLQMARMRSLETQRPMLRATNTGISAIIDHKGKIIGKSPQFKPHALSGTVTPRTGMTPYARTGNWLIVGLMFALLLIRYEKQ